MLRFPILIRGHNHQHNQRLKISKEHHGGELRQPSLQRPQLLQNPDHPPNPNPGLLHRPTRKSEIPRLLRRVLHRTISRCDALPKSENRRHQRPKHGPFRLQAFFPVHRLANVLNGVCGGARNRPICNEASQPGPENDYLHHDPHFHPVRVKRAFVLLGALVAERYGFFLLCRKSVHLRAADLLLPDNAVDVYYFGYHDDDHA